MRKQTIARRIWLSLSMLVLGYVVSLAAAYIGSAQTVRNITELGVSVFPAVLHSNDALRAFDRQVRSYEDAVAAAEETFLNAADRQAYDVRSALKRLGTPSGNKDGPGGPAGDLAAQHASWTADASKLYRSVLEQGSDSFLQNTHTELAMMAERTDQIRGRLLRLRTALINRQDAAVDDLSRRSARLRDMNMLIFCLVLLGSVAAVSRALNKHAIRPINDLVSVISKEQHIAPDAFPEGEIGDAARKVHALFEQERDAVARLAHHKANLENTVKERTAELSKAHDTLKLILEKAPFGVVVIGRDRIIRWSNGAMTSMAGLEEGDSLEGKACGEYLCPADQNACPVLDLGETLDRSERIVRRKDGTEIPVIKNVVEIEMNGEEVLLETLIDISEHKRIQAELEQAHKLESVGQLAAGIAHEINTPTQFIGDHIQFLKEGLEDLEPLFDKYRELVSAVKSGSGTPDLAEQVDDTRDEADEEYFREHAPKAIEQALDGVNRVASIVRAMKDFAHPGPATMAPTDINQAVQSTVTVCRNEWKYAAEMQLDLDESLPPVVCVPGEINQVILNMTVNAAHALAEKRGDGSESLGRITITTGQDNGFARISIADTGTGIPPDTAARIFDPFFTTKEVGKGTGQGLAIAHNIVVKKHGGSIDLESEVGKGTTFHVRLPISRVCGDKTAEDATTQSKEAQK